MSPPYKLTYFDIMGLGEPLRMLLTYGNLDFEDYRMPRELWPNLKPSMPFAQLPILEHDSKTFYQSTAIARFLAKKVKLMGKDEFEDLEIDAIVDTINDLDIKVVKYYDETDETAKEASGKVLLNETIPFYMGKLDNIAKENGGYFVGGKLTWADLMFVGRP